MAIILLHQKASKDEKYELKKIFKKNERTEVEFKKIIKLIKKYNIISDCYKKAEHFINLSANSLSVFENNKEKYIFQNLASFSLERTF